MRSALISLIFLGLLPQAVFADDSLFPHCNRREDVVYGRKFGTA